MSPSVVHEVREDHSERDDRNDHLENEYGLLTRRHLLERQLFLRRRRTPLRSLLWVAHIETPQTSKNRGETPADWYARRGSKPPPTGRRQCSGGEDLVPVATLTRPPSTTPRIDYMKFGGRTT